jgi:phosphate-selective porin OprO and OprP
VKRGMGVLVIAVAALGAPLFPAAAQVSGPLDRLEAADVSALQVRIAELEHQIEQLTARLAASHKSAAVHTAVATVEERVDFLDQQLRVLARRLEIEREQAAEAARTVAGTVAGRDGFQLKSADNAFVLKLRGLIQSDGRFAVRDVTNSGTDSFVMRRVRPTIEGTLFKIVDLRLMPDFGEGRTVLQDAWFDLRFSSGVKVRAGKFKSPLGLERLVSASDLQFVERGLPTTVAPNRDIGVMMHGDLAAGRLSYAAGVFNGVADGSSTDIDDTDGKDVVARLFSHPFRTSKNDRFRELGVGIAGSYGRQTGTIAAPVLSAYRSAGQQTFFRYRSDATAAGTTVSDGDRYRVSAQGYLYSGRLGVLAEHVVSSQRVRRGAAGIDAAVRAWQVASGWVLTGERASYKSVVPRASFDAAAGTWGAFELTARINQLAVGSDVFPVFASPTAAARSARAWSGGINWYLTRGVKIVLDYEQTAFRGGAATGDRPTERQLFSRLQLSF